MENSGHFLYKKWPANECTNIWALLSFYGTYRENENSFVIWGVCLISWVKIQLQILTYDFQFVLPTHTCEEVLHAATHYCPNLSSKFHHLLTPWQPSNSLPFFHYGLVTEHSFKIESTFFISSSYTGLLTFNSGRVFVWSDTHVLAKWPHTLREEEKRTKGSIHNQA